MGLEDRVRDAFGCVKADERLKVSTKEFLRAARAREGGRSTEKRDGGKRLSRPALRLSLVVACAALTVFLCIGSYAMLWMPVAYVSIDVNPSLELELNRLDRVISVRAYNEDGSRIAEGISVKGMYYEDALERIVGSEGMQPYLTQEGELTFTVATDSPPREEQLLAGINHSSGCVEHGGISVRADMSLVDEAHGNGLSLGKYLVYQILLQYEPDLTVQDCHDMSMSQIHGMIEEHEHGGNYGDGHGAGHGSGHGIEAGTDDEIESESSQSTEPPAGQPMEQPAGQDTGHHSEDGHGHKSGHGH